MICYGQPGKLKAQSICAAFAHGCGGKVGNVLKPDSPGPVMFYGVRPAWAHLWERAKARGDDYFYCDNSFFDCAREQYFRISKNAIQPSGLGASDGTRFAALGIEVKPWRTGNHILVCAQSVEFMRTVANDPLWLPRTFYDLRCVTNRPVRVRGKHDPKPLADDLRDAHLVVTWSSAAAVESLLAGVPVHCAPPCCADPFSTPLFSVEHPRKPEGRETWAQVLADNQWTLSEIKNGTAWRALTTSGK